MIGRSFNGICLGTMFVLALTVVGCSEGDKFGKTVVVKGKATLDGRPLSAASVVYIPDESKGNKNQVSVTGQVKNGEYTLMSSGMTGQKPGAPAGWYKVTIQPAMGFGAPGGDKAPKSAGAGTELPKSEQIAPKFTNADQTPLRIEVKEGNPATAYDLPVTSK